MLMDTSVWLERYGELVVLLFGLCTVEESVVSDGQNYGRSIRGEMQELWITGYYSCPLV